MSQTFSVQFAKDTRLATLRGHVVLFKAFEPRQVPEAIYRQAIAEGGFDGKLELKQPEAQAPQEPEKQEVQADHTSEEGIGDVEGTGTDSGVLRVAQICREIIEEADMDKLTSGNKPKLADLSQAAGFTVSAELRDEAMKMVEDGIV